MKFGTIVNHAPGMVLVKVPSLEVFRAPPHWPKMITVYPFTMKFGTVVKYITRMVLVKVPSLEVLRAPPHWPKMKTFYPITKKFYPFSVVTT